MAMDEIEAMKVISEKLEKLNEEERTRVLAWAVAKFATGQVASPSASQTIQPATSAATQLKTGKKSTAKAKTGKKAKTIISMDKSLNLSPSGKKSAAAFANEKSPTNAMQKGVVAVYYLREFIALEKVSVSAVYTFFKTLGWPLPADLANKLQQAGSQGWLDTSDRENIKLTSMGENLVEHKLRPNPLK